VYSPLAGTSHDSDWCVSGSCVDTPWAVVSSAVSTIGYLLSAGAPWHLPSPSPNVRETRRPAACCAQRTQSLMESAPWHKRGRDEHVLHADRQAVAGAGVEARWGHAPALLIMSA
jgi:hypothetical protein